MLLVMRKITKNESSFAPIFITVVFGFPFLLFYMINQGIPQVGTSFYFVIFLAAILDAVAFITLAKAVAKTPLSLVAPVFALAPLLSTIFAFLALGERPAQGKLLAIILIVFGGYVIHINDIQKGIARPILDFFKEGGVRLAFFVTILWSITPVLQKSAILSSNPHSPPYTWFVESIFLMLFLFPFIIRHKEIRKILRSGDILWFFLLGIFGTLGQIAGFTSMSLVNIGYFVSVTNLSILFSVILGVFILKEKHSKERLLGALIMVVGTILLAL